MSERTEVQNPVLKYASEIKWTPLSREDALTLRNGETGFFLYEVLREQLKMLNPGLVDDAKAN